MSCSQLAVHTGTYYYGNFLGGWNGLFRSPQMLSYADFWFSWSGGWWHRWTDQQFWPHALYVTNATGGVISLEHHRRHRAFVHVGG